MAAPADVAWAALCAAGCLLLAYAGQRHVARPQGLAGPLRAHAVLPSVLARRGTVVVLGVSEVVVGVGGLLCVVGAGGLLQVPSWAARTGLTTCALLYLAYGSYLSVVGRRSGSVPCGCLGDASRTSRGASVRALVFGTLFAGYAARPDLPQLSQAAGLGVLCAALVVVAVVVLQEQWSALNEAVAAAR